MLLQIKAAGELALQLVFFHPEADLGPAVFLLPILGGSVGILAFLRRKTCPGAWVLGLLCHKSSLSLDYLPLPFICPQIPFLADGVMDGLGGGENETQRKR